MFARITRMLLSALLVLPGALWAEAKIDRPPLWQVSANGQRAYLLGSFHFGTAAMYPMPAVVEQAFAASDMLVVEIDLTAIDAVAASRLIIAQGLYPQPEQSLRQHLDDDSWALLVRFGEDLGLPIEYLQRQKPWLAFMTLSQRLYQDLGYSEKLGVDLHFLERAHQQAKQVVELETFEGQIMLLDQLSEQEQVALLTETLLDFEQARAQAEQLANNWRQGELEAMDKLINGWFAEKPGLQRVQQVLLYDRNQAMAARTAELLEQGGKPFVVVGAGHLIGAGSVVDVLRAQGYQVERL
ncbi:MAG: TraB/GumN family protein [Gammaproteobacteria bacterium]